MFNASGIAIYIAYAKMSPLLDITIHATCFFDMYARCLDFTQNILIMSQYSIKFWIYLNRYSPPTKFFIYLDNLTLIQLFLWKSVIRRVGMNYHCNRISVSSFRKWRIVNNLSFLFFFFTINLLLISSFTNTAHRFYTVWLSTTI